jgi:predicted RNA-binding protein with TRAM domain
MGKYQNTKHNNEPIYCPREKCRRKNAPVESEEFSPSCWKCGTFLNVTPVETGDELTVKIKDIHENGAGVGKTEDGYVILVHGLLPPARAKVRITEVHPNYSNGELVKKLEEESDDENENENEEDEPSLGDRSNHWGK